MAPDPHKLTRFRHIIFCWLLFSCVYWITAYSKPFHVDEFYSWVYTERHTVSEILRLKEFGIGHPPLYHLMQKAVQTLLPGYHFLYVRTANYLVGSLFVVILGWVFLKHKYAPAFCHGVCLSATVIELFVFSRMWGLVSLSSLLLLWIGESDSEKPTGKALALLLGVCVLGLVSDYSFVVLLPYAALVFFSRWPWVRKLIPVGLGLLVVGWFLSTYRAVTAVGDPPLACIYRLVRDSARLSVKLANTVFNFWFVEPFVAAVLIFALLAILDVLRQRRAVRLQTLVPSGGLLPSLEHGMRRAVDPKNTNSRLVLALVVALLIILMVSPLFWRTLINKKYLFTLCPFLFFLMYRNLSYRSLHVVAAILFISGLSYVMSNRMVEWYPPQVFDESVPVLFQDEFAYSNQYFRAARSGAQQPFILDFSQFERYCRVCKMGTNNVPFQNYDTVWLVGWSDYDQSRFVPPEFTLSSTRGVDLTWLDKLQFKYLTPIPKSEFMIFEYHRIHRTS